MTRTLRNVLTNTSSLLAEAGIVDSCREARLLVRHATGWDEATMLRDPDRELDGKQAAILDAAVARRTTKEPMAYIAGEREFWSLTFRVTPATLIPRPDTETVVEAVLADVIDRGRPLRILDLGTGSGCLLLALLSELPAARGLGIDISRSALDVARSNAGRLGLDARASFRIGNWLNDIEDIFDVVVANPPYVPNAEISSLDEDVRAFEPLGALDGGADGLAAYRRIAENLDSVLAEDGLAIMEIGAGQVDSVSAVFAAQGFRIRAVRSDLAGIPRAVSVCRRLESGRD